MNDQVDRSVGGDHDQWILFDRRTPEEYPLVVLARTGNPLIEKALSDQIVTVVHCSADPFLVNDRGMPQHTDRLYPIEEALARELEAFDVGALHIASVTGDGERRIVFTHIGALEFAPILQLFNVEGYTLSASRPKDRAALRALVVPSALDRQLSGDMQVISNIEKHGDDGTAPRKTDFWFYGEKSALDKVAADLTPWGYSIDHWLDEPLGFVLTANTSVDFGTFCEVTPALVASAERHGVIYDGWETMVLGTGPELPAEPKQPKSLLSKLFGAKKN